MKTLIVLTLSLCVSFALSGSGRAAATLKFTEVTVHDPSILKVKDTYYVFGSHLASAKSSDLMNWTLISLGVRNGNPLIPNVMQEMNKTFSWAQTKTFWAPDVIQLDDQRFYMYYNACKGDSPRSALGVAVADAVEGPYRDLGIILKSGMWGEPSEDGAIYDATRHPNTVDPDTFFDKDGKLWMVYGSYSGGIYILKMDSRTGLPLPGQGYGKKLLGGNHSRIEGPCVLYSPQTGYYYLFLSFGGLDSQGGYNIRVARSRQPDGPYYDPAGHDMIEAHGAPGTLFDDSAIAPFGAKLMGGFQLDGTGYLSPGHNSVFYDTRSGKYLIVFHTRFSYRGEAHEVRVHQMFMNAQGWPVVAPHRYTGESIEKYQASEIVGQYNLVNHARDISAVPKQPIPVKLAKDGTISGGVKGKWKLTGEHGVELIVDGVKYTGVFLRQWDTGVQSQVMTFSALSADGVAIWGSRPVAVSQSTGN